MKKIALIALALAVTATDAQAQWTTLTFVDEWGEADGTGAQSRPTKAVRAMSFPYGDVTARLMVSRCENAWIRFSEAPNLSGGDIGSGYTTYRIPVRIDGQRETWKMSQDFGSKDLTIGWKDRNAIDKWSKANLFEISLPWYGETNARFAFDMSGSAKAIGATC